MSKDTTKKNMGRRQMPCCQTWGCRLRVDKPDDKTCRLCRSFAGDRHVIVDGALEPKHG